MSHYELPSRPSYTLEEFDALVIPRGYSPDKLRADAKMVGLTRRIHEAHKPVAAICHAGWMLIEADLVRGRTVTSWPSIRTDLENTGARWIDQQVVEDHNLITSRKPDDLPAFCEALLRQTKQSCIPPLQIYACSFCLPSSLTPAQARQQQEVGEETDGSGRAFSPFKTSDRTPQFGQPYLSYTRSSELPSGCTARPDGTSHGDGAVC